jgi:hypothetical protein
MFTIHFYRFLLEKENFVTLGITEISAKGEFSRATCSALFCPTALYRLWHEPFPLRKQNLDTCFISKHMNASASVTLLLAVMKKFVNVS